MTDIKGKRHFVRTHLGNLRAAEYPDCPYCEKVEGRRRECLHKGQDKYNYCYVLNISGPRFRKFFGIVESRCPVTIAQSKKV